MFASPGDLSNPGIESTSLAWAGGFFATAPLGKPKNRLKEGTERDTGAKHTSPCLGHYVRKGSLLFFFITKYLLVACSVPVIGLGSGDITLSLANKIMTPIGLMFC